MMALAQKTDNEIKAIIEPMIDNMLAGSTEINHAKHVRDFTDRLKVIVTDENLSQQCTHYQKEVGHFRKREFIALFRRRHSVAATWRLFFTKTNDEFVLEALFVDRGNGLKIEHCMIF